MYAFDQWIAPSDFNHPFRSAAARNAIIVKTEIGLLVAGINSMHDDWQLLKGLWLHGVDRFEALETSPYLDFARKRVGTTVAVDSDQSRLD